MPAATPKKNGINVVARFRPVSAKEHAGMDDEICTAFDDDGKTVAWTGAAKRTRSHYWAGVIDQIWILDVEGTRILIDVISMPVEQEIIRERADEVIDSLRLAANN